MDSWVKQIGYPVLQVDSERAEEHLELSISQERFVYDRPLGPGSAEDGGSDSEVWQVPVTVNSGGEASAATVMEGRETRLEMPAVGGWFKVNTDQTGFCRVNYSNDDWQRLVPAVSSLELSATDRLGVQNDAYALSKAGLLPISQFLELARAYVNETDASVWGDLASNLRDIEQLIAGEAVHPAYQEFARGLFGPAARRAGWEPRPGDGHLDALPPHHGAGPSGELRRPGSAARGHRPVPAIPVRP